MALDPPLLLLDEPSAGLDPITSAGLDRLILDLRQDLGATFVVVTHELASILAIADRCIMLDRAAYPRCRRHDRRRRSARAARHQHASDRARVLPSRSAGGGRGLMEGRGVYLRVGLLILAGIAPADRRWSGSSAAARSAHGDAVRVLFQRIGAGAGSRRAGQVSRRDDRPRDGYRSGQRRIRPRQRSIAYQQRDLPAGVRALRGRHRRRSARCRTLQDGREDRACAPAWRRRESPA